MNRKCSTYAGFDLPREEMQPEAVASTDFNWTTMVSQSPGRKTQQQPVPYFPFQETMSQRKCSEYRMCQVILDSGSSQGSDSTD